MSKVWAGIVDDTFSVLDSILPYYKDQRQLFECIATISKIMTEERLDSMYYSEDSQLVKDPDGTLHLVSHGVD